MAKALWIKKGKGLWPACERTEGLLDGIPEGSIVTTSAPLQSRNPYFHRLVMKILSIVIEHTWPRFANIDGILDYLKLKSGMVDEVEICPGYVKVKMKSIAFHKMGEVEFQQVWKQWGAIISTELMPGVDPEELLNEAKHAA